MFDDDVINVLYTALPAIKYANVVDPGSEGGAVTFPFRHPVMEASVTWSPDDGMCDTVLSEMTVTVNFSGLNNSVEYTMTVDGVLVLNGQQLPFTLSESLTPMDSSPPPPTSGY